MGIVKYLFAKAVGSNRRMYEALGEFQGTRRLTRNIQRDARRALTWDKRRVKELKEIEDTAKDAVNNPKMRQELLKELDKRIPKFLNSLKQEIKHNAQILIGTESLLYQMKVQMIDVLDQEMVKMGKRGFPRDLGQELRNRVIALKQGYEDDLNKLRTWTRNEFRGRFQLATVAIRSEKRLEREMRKDAKRLRRLERDFERTMRKLRSAEDIGKVDETIQSFDRLIKDLTNELKLLMEIAQDDITVMHKIKEPIQELGTIIQNSVATPDKKQQWTTGLQEVNRYEERILRDLRSSTRRLEQREA